MIGWPFLSAFLSSVLVAGDALLNGESVAG